MPPLFAAPRDTDFSTNGFRLTLTTGVPVTTTDVLSATSVFLTPYTSMLISLYDGARWIPRVSGEVSLALGTVTSGLNYDVFAVWSGSAVVLEKVAWTNDTTRASLLGSQFGVVTKSSDPLRRYVGTFRTNSTTTTCDTAGSTTASAKRFLFNQYMPNRVLRPCAVNDPTASWTFTNAPLWRQANANAINQIEIVCGDSLEVDAHVQACWSAAGSASTRRQQTPR
jgi:hypothetical protein